MAKQLLVEITGFKISRSIWKLSSTNKVIAFVEGHYNSKSIKSEEAKLHVGTIFGIPCTTSLESFTIHYFMIDGLLTVDIGKTIFQLRTYELADGMQLPPLRLDIIQHGTTTSIGNVRLVISVQDLYSAKPLQQLPLAKTSELDFALPGFRFKRLTKACNWDRVRSVNIEKFVN
jgi:hypothetical protein